MNRYILNSAVVTTPGHYKYEHLSVQQARAWLLAGKFESTIGYPETASALSALTGIPIAVDRKNIKMKTGNEALIFRLTCRMNDPELKGKLTPEYVMRNCEIGLLTKEA